MSETASTAVSAPAVHPLRLAYFRNFWAGATISLLGDQFYFVGLSWLVLQLTGSSLTLGTVMMVAAIPRAVFMLMGGAVSDRSSPRRVLISTASARTVLVLAVAALAYWRVLRLWEVYVLAGSFGFADAFSFPAIQALIPGLVATDQLPAANSLISGSVQISTIAGPAPAGALIKRWGVAVGFLIDAVSFLFVIWPLYRLPEAKQASGPQPRRAMVHEILEGLRYVAGDATLRSLMLLVAALNLALAGPAAVGLATMAKQRFGSAAAFGTLLSSLGMGALVGTLLAGVLKYKKRRGLVLLLATAALGMGMAVIGLLHHLWLVAIILVVMGAGSGFSNVNLTAWFQARVDRALLGRVMSVLMFSALGLLPVSYAIAGAAAEASLTAMFVGAGGLAVLMACVAGTNRTVRQMD